MLHPQNLRDRMAGPGWIAGVVAGAWKALELWHTTEFALHKIAGSAEISRALGVFGLAWLTAVLFLPPAPRRLAGGRRKKFEAALRQYDHAKSISVLVSPLSGGSDTADFAVDIRDALNASGIQSQLSSMSLSGDAQHMARGIWVTGHDQFEQTGEPLESLLIRALRDAGFDARHAKSGHDQVAVFIGARD
jgi:hypothetical protein